MRLLTLLFVLLLCLDANAQFLSPEWGYSFGSPNDDASYATATDAAGNVYVGGEFTGTIDFDPGPGTTYLSTSPGVQTFFLQKLDPFGNLLWAKKLFPRSNLVYEGLRMEVDAGGNVYLSDSFKGGIDFDPGSGRFVLGTSGGNMDIFIVKLDASGNFLWVTQTGGSTHDEVKSISIDPTGNIYCLGQYRNQVDFDPGPGVFNLTAQQGGASFIQKLSPSGDFLWAKSFDGIDYGGLSQIKADLAGNVLAVGVFWRTQDFDPGPNTFSLTSTNSGNIFTLKLDAEGDFQWAVQIVGTDAAYQVFFAVDPLGEIYISSTFSGTSDFDPGPGVSSLTSANGGSWQDLFLQKLDGDGNLLWVKQMSSPGLADAFIESGVLEISSAGIIYLTGDFLAHSPTGASIDFDPGPGLAEVFLVDSPVNSIVASYSPEGNLFWAKSIAGTYYRMVRDIATDQHENIYLSGSIYDTVDFDPGLDTFDLRATNQRLDFYLIKWSQDSCFGLASVIDNSINIGCSSTGYSSGHAMGGQAPYSYQWNTLPADTNNFTRFTDPGLYEFTVSDTDGCSHTSRVLISAPSNQQGGDLQVNITTTDFRTGFDAKIWLDAFNDGCIPVSGEVILVLDPFLTYKSASPLPDTLRGDTLVWKVNNISYDSPHFTAQVDVTVSTEARIGDLICLDASIKF